MNRIDQHLLLDRAVLVLQQFDTLTEEEQDYLSDLREALWKQMDGKQAEELEARWRGLQTSVGWRKGEPPEGTDHVMCWRDTRISILHKMNRFKGEKFAYWEGGRSATAWNPDWFWMPLPSSPEKKS